MSRKTEAIKFRCEPTDKKLLRQFAQDDKVELSDVCRRAAQDYIEKRTKPAPSPQPTRQLLLNA